jgi:hypothetical protein
MGPFEALNDVFWEGTRVMVFYCSSQLDLFNELLCVPNGYGMRKWHSQKVDVETDDQKYLLEFQKYLLELHILGLGFWTFRVLDLC